MVNKFAGQCVHCLGRVPANGGSLFRVGRRWVVAHLACEKRQGPAVVVTRFSSGEEVFRNVNGRCEDAPCCGCCS